MRQGIVPGPNVPWRWADTSERPPFRPKWLRRRDRPLPPTIILEIPPDAYEWEAELLARQLSEETGRSVVTVRCRCIINENLGETEDQWQRLPGPSWCAVHRQGGVLR
jgi:hypothetical protein